MATTAAATAAGLFNAATRRGERGVVLKIGDRAPEFELVASDGQTYRLTDSLGHEAVVIAWFPKAFTAGCTAQCESLGRSSPTLRGFNVKYFGASVDRPEANRRFAGSMGIDYPILSDPEAAAARAYGVLAPSGFAHRWTFYIGPDGRILDIDRHVRTASHGEDVAIRLGDLNISRRP